MMDGFLKLGLVGIASFLIAAPAESVTILDENGYEFIEQSLPWDEALSAAAALRYRGQPGHLAVITSREENDFIYDLVASVIPRPSGFSGAWIGGLNGSWVVGPEAGHRFTTHFTNFGGVEPNNVPSYVYLMIGDGAGAVPAQPGEWLDGAVNPSAGDPVIGFFVEYEGVASIPTPAAFGMLATGLFCLVAVGGSRGRRLSFKQA